jgi:hypothetical protein
MPHARVLRVRTDTPLMVEEGLRGALDSVSPARLARRDEAQTTPEMTLIAAVTVTPQIAARMRSTLARSAVRAHARAEVASACRACGGHANPSRSTRRFCSGACRQRAYRAGRRPILAPVAHQARIREREAAADPRPQMATLEGSTVEQIPFAEAKALILRYEWLRSMPTGTLACYGLRTHGGDLAGVVAFARGPAPESHDLCGPENRDLAVCLARGACVHWAHPNAASFLIARACKLAHRDHGWEVFFAYADPRAGEVGAVYQAANWLYLGQGVGRRSRSGRWRFFSRREGRWRAERAIRQRRLVPGELRSHPNWIAEWTPDKGRYVWFEGIKREKRDLRQALKYAPQPYPKRGARALHDRTMTGKKVTDPRPFSKVTACYL